MTPYEPPHSVNIFFCFCGSLPSHQKSRNTSQIRRKSSTLSADRCHPIKKAEALHRSAEKAAHFLRIAAIPSKKQKHFTDPQKKLHTFCGSPPSHQKSRNTSQIRRKSSTLSADRRHPIKKAETLHSSAEKAAHFLRIASIPSKRWRSLLNLNKLFIMFWFLWALCYNRMNIRRNG